jgi:peptidoglycan biosynthesis protein MviN/MurJ (putative lipid II flippase)
MSDDKSISVNINLSKIVEWVRGHVLWTTSIVSGFILWRFLSTAWYMPEGYWTPARTTITILGSIICTAIFLIVTGNAIVIAYDNSKGRR